MSTSKTSSWPLSKPPSLQAIKTAHQALAGTILHTPVWHWQGEAKDQHFGAATELFVKLELWQHTGSFKPRGALTVMLNLTPDQLKQGVVTVSAGNHAIAVAYAAKIVGTHAKVIILKSANPYRVQQCRHYGAEVIFADHVQAAFDQANTIAKQENRSYVHPFEGPNTTLGTATLGLEFCQDVASLDAMLIAIGGGGLISGVAAAVKHLQPNCRIIGIEPEGADTMHRSFASGQPESIATINTIADSLGTPYTAPYSFSLCQQLVDQLVRISDADMIQAMTLLANQLKLIVEPAGAAALAALLKEPLNSQLQGKRVGILLCGSNIDINSFSQLLASPSNGS